MRSLLPLAVVFGLALAVQPALAQEADILVRVSATGVQVEDEADLHGVLAGFRFEHDPGTGAAPFAEDGFTALASQAKVVRYADENGVGASIVTLGSVTERSEDDFAAASLTGGAAREGAKVYILPVDERPAPTVTYQGPGGAFSASDRETLVAKIMPPYGGLPGQAPEEDETASVAGTHRWQAKATGGVVTVHGDLLLSLFEVDVVVATDDGEATYTSGETQEPHPSDPSGAVEARTLSQVYLFLTNATLTLPWYSATEADLYVGQPSAHVVGGLILHDVFGEIVDSQTRHVAIADKLLLEGDMLVRLDSPAPSDASYAVFVSGDISKAELDGQPLALTGGGPKVQGTNGGLPWFLWAAAALTLPLAGTGVEAIRRHRLTIRFHELERRLDAGDFEAVADGAAMLVRSRSHRVDASVMKVLALIQLGRYDDALSFLDGAGAWKGPAGATLQYLYGYVYAAKGQAKEAVARLSTCLEISPDFKAEIVANPVFQPMLSDPALAPHFPSKPVRRNPGTNLGGYA